MRAHSHHQHQRLGCEQSSLGRPWCVKFNIDRIENYLGRPSTYVRRPSTFAASKQTKTSNVCNLIHMTP